jgi:hypothetical protein
VRRLLYAQAGTKAAEHFELAVGKTFMRHPLEARVDEGGKSLGERIADIATAAEYASHRIQ